MPILSNTGAVIVPPSTAAVSNDIRGIKPPVQIPNNWIWIAWLGAALLFTVLAAVLWKRYRQRLFPPKSVVAVPPHLRAKQRLREALSLIHDPRLFCIAVSDALRVYLEERFNFKAPERTTEEFMVDLQKTSLLSEQQKASLAAFLQQCDLVKFARLEPNEAELRLLHDAALRLIDETQYDPVQAPSAPLDKPQAAISS